MLPSSKAIMDRATIKSHLLSDTKDPFNRMPLSIEDVVPSSSVFFSRVTLSNSMFLSAGIEGSDRRIPD